MERISRGSVSQCFAAAYLVDGVHLRYRKIKISAKTVHCSLLSYKIFEAGWSPALNKKQTLEARF